MAWDEINEFYNEETMRRLRQQVVRHIVNECKETNKSQAISGPEASLLGSTANEVGNEKTTDEFTVSEGKYET